MSKRPLILAVSLTLAHACGSRTSEREIGGKTSWLASCDTDTDCGSLEDAVCVQQLCTRGCERSDCDGVAGTTCAESGLTCLTRPTCLPGCEDDSDCRKFGVGHTCRGSVCFAESCATDDATGTVNDATASLSPSIEPSRGAPVGETTTNGAAGMPSANGVTDFITDDSTAGILCAVSLDEAPAQRPYRTLLIEWGYDLMLSGEPGCTGSCGYEYVYNDELWVYNPDLQCPLDISGCEQLETALSANPARCNTADDCTAYAGSFRPCEPFLDKPYYFDSALFTPDQRAAREAILNEMKRNGCREPRFAWDGPTYELGCVDNLCTLVELGTCQGSPDPVECDACTPSLDAGLGD